MQSMVSSTKFTRFNAQNRKLYSKNSKNKTCFYFDETIPQRRMLVQCVLSLFFYLILPNLLRALTALMFTYSTHMSSHLHGCVHCDSPFSFRLDVSNLFENSVFGTGNDYSNYNFSSIKLMENFICMFRQEFHRN